MFEVLHSNRLETLADALLEHVGAAQADPFRPETIVVQNPGMGVWLAHRLAEQGGIAANLRFPLPAAFIWEAFRAWHPELTADSPFARDLLHWRIRAALPELLADPAFAEPRAYLAHDPDGIKLHQLCTRLADLFDQYLVYRPDWIAAWEAGSSAPAHGWQALLWRELLRRSSEGGDSPHWAETLNRFLGAVATRPPQGALPERVALFGINALTPAYLQVLEALSGHCEVRLFVLNPCREYWADIEAEAGQARRRARARRARLPDPTGLLDLGNPLLAAWGHAGQAFLDQLLESGAGHDDRFEPAPHDTLLHRIQNHILDLHDGRAAPETLDAEDGTISIHACHTPQREIQVLHDRLLHLFETISGLEPRDVLVMAPDIAPYAPYVEAVFGTNHVHLPWSIGDGGAASPAVTALRTLLQLPQSRLPASEVLALLEVPALQARLGLDDEAVGRIHAWVRDTGIRWGADAAHRARLGLPHEGTNTWAFGLRRLFAGFALPPEAAGPLADTIAPWPHVEGGEAEVLGRLARLIDRLHHWQGELRRARPPQAWQTTLNALIDDLFAPLSENDPFEPVREALQRQANLARRAGFKGEIELAVIAADLDAALEAPPPRPRLFSGGVTFCNLAPMRSVPARVICLIGMNGDAFPRGQRPPRFDLIAAHPRRGDRSRRHEERYLFLEALLSARDALHISYLGNDPRDNAPRTPSVVVSELLEYAGQALRLRGGDLGAAIHLHHPLQPFSRRYFDGSEPRLFSYAGRWLDTARTEASETPPFSDAPLPEPAEAVRRVTLADLIGLLHDPAGFFLRRRLGVALARGDAAPVDDEPFILDDLGRFDARQRLLAILEEGADGARITATGVLPHGGPGQVWLEDERPVAERFLERFAAYEAPPAEPLDLDLAIGPFRLEGRLDHLTDTGRLDRRFGRLRAKDRLGSWVAHLALCALAPAGLPHESRFVADDAVGALGPVADAKGCLLELLNLYWEGLSRPLPFFPETSLVQAAGGPVKELNRAWEQEGARSAVEIAFRGRDPLGEGFAELAGRVFGPMLEHESIETG